MAKQRKYKGNSLIKRINDYVVIDIETTGLYSEYDDIIEIAAIKVINNEIVEEFQSLIKIDYSLSYEIIKLTGISNQDLKDAPTEDEVIKKFSIFIEDMILVGHNVNFDINFLYDRIKNGLRNDFIDTLRISRRLYPNFENHKLVTVCNNLKISNKQAHRALSDVYATFEIYQMMKLNSDFTEQSYRKKLDKNIKKISNEKINVNQLGIVKNKCFVLTGKFEEYTKKEIEEIIIIKEGISKKLVTKKIDYLVVSNSSLENIQNKKSISKKVLKAIELQKEGHDIKIISENHLLYNLSSYE